MHSSSTTTIKSWRAWLRVHPAADIFPLMADTDPGAWDAFVANIKNGLREPAAYIRDNDGPVLLDGRNRLDALERTGRKITPETLNDQAIFKQLSATLDAVAYIVSENLHRRHLSESQRAMVAARLAALQLGANQHSEGTSIEGASHLLNVGRASVERAKTVQRDGTSELQRAVEMGKVSVSAAADVATRPVDEQHEIVARGTKEILEAAKAIRAERAAKKSRRLASARHPDKQPKRAIAPRPPLPRDPGRPALEV
jgi:hypothetical protein